MNGTLRTPPNRPPPRRGAEARLPAGDGHFKKEANH